MPRLPIRVKLLRMRSLPNDGSRTLFFVTAGGDRRHRPTFFQPDQVPDFDGEEAVFEVDKRRGVWTFVRQVITSG